MRKWLRVKALHRDRRVQRRAKREVERAQWGQLCDAFARANKDHGVEVGDTDDSGAGLQAPGRQQSTGLRPRRSRGVWRRSRLPPRQFRVRQRWLRAMTAPQRAAWGPLLRRLKRFARQRRQRLKVLRERAQRKTGPGDARAARNRRRRQNRAHERHVDLQASVRHHQFEECSFSYVDDRSPRRRGRERRWARNEEVRTAAIRDAIEKEKMAEAATVARQRERERFAVPPAEERASAPWSFRRTKSQCRRRLQQQRRRARAAAARGRPIVPSGSTTGSLADAGAVTYTACAAAQYSAQASQACAVCSAGPVTNTWRGCAIGDSEPLSLCIVMSKGTWEAYTHASTMHCGIVDSKGRVPAP
jgi:hypothetical protein